MATVGKAQLREWAKAFVSEKFTHQGLPTLYYWRDKLWRWDGRRYVAEQVLSHRLGWVGRRIEDWLSAKGVDEGGWVTEDVLKSLTAMMELGEGATMPTWLGEGRPGQFLMGMANGLVDVGRAAMGEAVEVREQSPKWFSQWAVDYPYVPEATCPVWERHLETCLEGDQERIALLQEWFGYCLQPSTKAQAVMVWDGAGGTGKSTTLAVLRQLVGEANCATVGLSQMVDKYALPLLEGKLLNVGDESNSLPAGAEDLFKKIVQGSGLVVEEKYEPLRQAGKMATKYIFSANGPIEFKDASTGVWRRLLMMRWSHVISSAEKRMGMDEPDDPEWPFRRELPGIFNWAMVGLGRLIKNNWQFTVPASSEELKAERRRDSDPLRSFVEEYYTMGEGGMTACSDFYQAYVEHCEANGERTPESSNMVGRKLHMWGSDTKQMRIAGTTTRRKVYWNLQRRRDVITGPA